MYVQRNMGAHLAYNYIGSEGNPFNLYPVVVKKLDSMETTSMSLSLPGFNQWPCAL